MKRDARGGSDRSASRFFHPTGLTVTGWRQTLGLFLSLAAATSFLVGCLSEPPDGLAKSTPAEVTVKMDFFARPLPEIPLPNDIATRYDPTSATGRRINASVIAPTGFERRVRQLMSQLDGWGAFMPITIPFTGPLDAASVLRGHRDDRYDPSDDVVYLIDIDRGSPDFGRIHHLDVGNGNFPVILEQREFWKNDPRNWTISLLFEEEDEDANANGRLDVGEDTDSDGVLDRPNYLPGAAPLRDDLAARADALMTFYERESSTVILRPLVPLRERTTYAVVVTRRLLDADGMPVGSPYPTINHPAQTEALRPLLEVLPDGLTLDEVAFSFSFTTQSLQSDFIAVRDGLYGHGVQAHLAGQFPAELAGLEPLRDTTHRRFLHIANPYVAYTEDLLDSLELAAELMLGAGADTFEGAYVLDSFRYVDFHVVGSFTSPQLFRRQDDQGRWLPLNDQVWPPDLDRVPAETWPEQVYFHLTVPRPEVSARGEGQPAPVVLMSHGYGSSRLEALAYGGFFAKYGLATLSIDCVSHGLGVSDEEREAIGPLLGIFGLMPFGEALLLGRAFDQDNDGRADSGADFWTAYMFHTRDVVRQSALDYMQMIRILRSFDGVRRWQIDVDGDGEHELAGDFDGDGAIDVGGAAPISMSGGSLGGIMSMLVGAIEPEIEVAIPISGGGGLTDVGNRSHQGGVREAFTLRLLGPLYVGTPEGEGGDLRIETIVPDLASARTLPIATVPGISPGDLLVVENLVNGSLGCAFVQPNGRVRTAVESDEGDATRLAFYPGDALIDTATCTVDPDADPIAVIDEWEFETEFQGVQYAAERPLAAMADGLGLRRASPSLRRFFGLGQLIADPGDPASYARHFLLEPLVYPGTGQSTGAHLVVVTTLGDMNVPVNSGVAFGRAAGLIDYLEDDPRFDTPPNQVLIDTYTVEAVNTLKRYTSAAGEGVHLDVEDFSQGTDLWGDDIPRLDPPLRLGFDRHDRWGGFSSAIFPLGIPTGQHGFPLPGEMTDRARADCRAACTGGDCGCEELVTFDTGIFMLNMLGRYLGSEGTDLDADLCNSRDDCDDRQPIPELRQIGMN
ncbi:MAG: hypothetical protein JW797_15765 [Bradymonadales bacterium]|nr:hypothetical protein [Bradymonadales bacterium]